MYFCVLRVCFLILSSVLLIYPPDSFLGVSSQDLQDEVAKESEELQRLQAQRQKVQEALDDLDQQKSSLEEQLTHIRQQTSQETNLVGLLFYVVLLNFSQKPKRNNDNLSIQISSLQTEHEEQEQRICQYEEELVQAREELLALQDESRRLQEKVQAAQEQLTPLQESVRDSFMQVAQVRHSGSVSLSLHRRHLSGLHGSDGNDTPTVLYV